jgi:hypothetical protein
MSFKAKPITNVVIPAPANILSVISPQPIILKQVTTKIKISIKEMRFTMKSLTKVSLVL